MNRFQRMVHIPMWKNFCDFLQERQRIWHSKEILGNPPPWTEDKVLREAKFTNIYRELDRVSRFEIKEITSNSSIDFKEKIKRILLLRHTNSPRIYNHLISGGDLAGLYDLWNLSTKKDYFVSDALMFVSGPGYDRASWIYHYWEELNRTIDQIYCEIFTEFELMSSGRSTARSSGQKILKMFPAYLPRIGTFFSYEFLTSMTYCSDCLLTEDDFMVVGPGAIPGLQIIMEEDDLGDVSQLVYDLAPMIREKLLKEYPDYIWIPEECQPNHVQKNKFTARTMEHSLCEFRKYWKIKHGRRIRRKYQYEEQLGMCDGSEGQDQERS